jgi:pyruvate,water dikinase
LFTGEKAISFYNKLNLKKAATNINKTNGQCAYAGKARGIARLIFTPDQMNKMHKGDILISQATSPDLIPAMKLAGAIVTNTGGLICHAAITSRELKIPCVVGTGNATEVFKDGDLIEVDATKGIVKLIKKSGS